MGKREIWGGGGGGGGGGVVVGGYNICEINFNEGWGGGRGRTIGGRRKKIMDGAKNFLVVVCSN